MVLLKQTTSLKKNGDRNNKHFCYCSIYFRYYSGTLIRAKQVRRPFEKRKSLANPKRGPLFSPEKDPSRNRILEKLKLLPRKKPHPQHPSLLPNREQAVSWPFWMGLTLNPSHRSIQKPLKTPTTMNRFLSILRKLNTPLILRGSSTRSNGSGFILLMRQNAASAAISI